MTLVSAGDVQAWFADGRLRIDSDDDLEEEIHARSIVLGQLQTRFDVSDWVSPDTTPKLVRTIISMLTAAYRYNNFITVPEGQTSYGDRLQANAMVLLQQVVDGQLILDEATDGPAVTGTLSFYPTDASTAIDDEDDAGRKFSMGMRF